MHHTQGQSGIDLFTALKGHKPCFPHPTQYFTQYFPGVFCCFWNTCC